MKKWLIWGYVLLIGCMLSSCREEEKVDPLAYAVITGQIENREVYPRQRSLKIIIPSFDRSKTVEECVIKDDHTFTFRF